MFSNFSNATAGVLQARIKMIGPKGEDFVKNTLEKIAALSFNDKFTLMKYFSDSSAKDKDTLSLKEDIELNNRVFYLAAYLWLYEITTLYETGFDKTTERNSLSARAVVEADKYDKEQKATLGADDIYRHYFYDLDRGSELWNQLNNDFELALKPKIIPPQKPKLQNLILEDLFESPKPTSPQYTRSDRERVEIKSVKLPKNIDKANVNATLDKLKQMDLKKLSSVEPQSPSHKNFNTKRSNSIFPNDPTNEPTNKQTGNVKTIIIKPKK